MSDKGKMEDQDEDERRSDLAWTEEKSKCVKRQQDPSGYEASQRV